MSTQDLMRFKVVSKFHRGEYSEDQAALKLNISVRQLYRISKKAREQGIEGIKHGNSGKKPHNKTSPELLGQYVELYRTTYSKFNYKHALEMIAMHEEIPKVSYSVFRIACREAGIGKVKKRRANKARVSRARHAEEGFMWQLDGSPDNWMGDDKHCLVALIDDATSVVPGAELHPTETTWACMNVVRKAITRYGIPEFIVTDGAGWSSGETRKRKHFSQFEAACLLLGITVIATSSPESKGRIERLNRTFQDRLIPELGLYGIKGLIDSNRYLDQTFIPEWNEKFTVHAESVKKRYRAVPNGLDLKEVFCLRKNRIVNRCHQVHYEGETYIIQPEAGKTYKNKHVEVREYEDKTISICYGDAKLAFVKQKKLRRRWDKAS